MPGGSGRAGWISTGLGQAGAREAGVGREAVREGLVEGSAPSGPSSDS